jgi:asparagine synthase (glutamine-hydrolysing)
MSGIAGAWNLDGRPMAEDVLMAMSRTLRHRGRDGEGHWIAGSVGLSCQHLWVTPEEQGEHQPILARRADSGARLVMDGRLDNREELFDALPVRPAHAISDGACVLDAYEAWGDRFAARLNGDFAIAIFDPHLQQLVLVRDAIGVRPLYYFHSPRLFAFASEIKALLAHPDITPQPDDEGLADFMLIGSRPLDHQELTCFRGISAVIPAHVVTVTPKALERTRYWDFDTTRQVRFRKSEDYVDAFHGLFTSAVRRRTRSAHPIAISVSGGLDSSSVFCQAEMLRRSTGNSMPGLIPLSYVSDRHETDEQQFLETIEARYGTPIDRFPIEPLTGLVRGAEEQVNAIEAPLVDYMWGVTRELQTRAAAGGARSLLSGHWGDQMLFSPAYLVDLLRRGAWPEIWRHTRAYARYFGEQETSRRRRLLLFDACRELVPQSIAPPLKWLRLRLFERRQPKGWFTPAFLKGALKHRYRLATFERRFHSAHARAVYVEARSKYQVQCMEWNNKTAALRGLDMSFPFLDRDLIAFLMAIPGEAHARDGVARFLLREAMSGVLPDAIRARTWKSDFSAFVNMGLGDDAAEILRTLHGECLAVRYGYLDSVRLAPELARLAADLKSADCVSSWDLGDTYSLEMWLQVFLGREKDNAPERR